MPQKVLNLTRTGNLTSLLFQCQILMSVRSESTTVPLTTTALTNWAGTSVFVTTVTKETGTTAVSHLHVLYRTFLTSKEILS